MNECSCKESFPSFQLCEFGKIVVTGKQEHRVEILIFLFKIIVSHAKIQDSTIKEEITGHLHNGFYTYRSQLRLFITIRICTKGYGYNVTEKISSSQRRVVLHFQMSVIDVSTTSTFVDCWRVSEFGSNFFKNKT